MATKKLRKWKVPVEGIIQGTLVIEAADEGEAIEAADDYLDSKGCGTGGTTWNGIGTADFVKLIHDGGQVFTVTAMEPVKAFRATTKRTPKAKADAKSETTKAPAKKTTTTRGRRRGATATKAAEPKTPAKTKSTTTTKSDTSSRRGRSRGKAAAPTVK